MQPFSKNFRIQHLTAGGIITNYYCSSACLHCLYGCSPRWPKAYIDLKTLGKNLNFIKDRGCRSVHVGGGEPFLNPEGLLRVVETVFGRGVAIEYVETNSSWFTSAGAARRLLTELKGNGLSTLLISISPFHNAHVPFYKVKGVLEACRTVGMRTILWSGEFYGEIDSFDDRAVHGLREYVEKFGPNYLKQIPSRYWIHLGGRALETFAGIYAARPLEEILSSGQGGCRELLDTRHFHVDLFGRYIPGLCSGIAIAVDDLAEELPAGKYPLFETLFGEGVPGLFKMATGAYNFRPLSAYLSKCDLCLNIRRHLVGRSDAPIAEFQPTEFYQQV